jgi:hypothetical protein
LLTRTDRKQKSLLLNLLKGKLLLDSVPRVALVLRGMLSLLVEPVVSLVLLDEKFRFLAYHETECGGRSLDELSDELVRVALDVRPKPQRAILVFGRVIPTLLYTVEVQMSLQEQGKPVPEKPAAAEEDASLPDEELTAIETTLMQQVCAALDTVKIQLIDTFLVAGFSVLSSQEREAARERAQEVELYRLRLKQAAEAVTFAAETGTALPDDVVDLLVTEGFLELPAEAPVAPAAAATDAAPLVEEPEVAEATPRVKEVHAFDELDKLLGRTDQVGAPAPAAEPSAPVSQAQ